LNSQADSYEKKVCRLCGSARLTKVLSLTPTPPGNHFVPLADRDKPQKSYPLALNFCEDCRHVQLTHCVNPVILYQTNYSYVSGTSPVFVAYLKAYADEIASEYSLPKDALVIDIGSNDGTALGFFKAKGFRTLGVDPAVEVAAIATKKGIETITDFFDDELAIRNRDRYGGAKLINSHNTCAHIDGLSSVIRGVEHWLDDDGLFVMEVGYLHDVVSNGWFDTIYHEHVDFHTAIPLIPFFRAHGLQVIDVKRVSPQGGSIRVVAQKIGGKRPVNSSVAEIVKLETDAGLDRAETFFKFGERIEAIKKKLGELIAGLKRDGRSIAGFGAPTKATTLLSHFNLAYALDFLVDENPLKENLLSPGHHIPVLAAGAIYERKPDYLIVLAWNFAEDIMRRHNKYVEQGGRFVLPMPEPTVISGDK
jgi:SAM-dependent methyltransferase